MSLVGSKKRKRIVEYFSQTQFCTIEKNYSADRNSIIRKLSKAKVKRVSGYQHSESEVDGHAYFRTRWQYAGAVVITHLPVEWLQAYDHSFNRACSLLYPEQSRWVSCTESSMAQLVIGTPTREEYVDAATHSRNLAGTSPEVKADLYQESWSSFQKHPLLYLTRKAGRVYHGMTNQPKILRRQHLSFECDGGVEKTAEIDMSSTYYVLLTSMLDAGRCKDQLIQDLTEGCFYRKLGEASGNRFTDTQELKMAVNRDCLFGKRDFGKTPLFVAMEKQFPDLARFIRHKRRHHDVSWLSDVLTNAEGSFFIDLLLPFVVGANVPALTIHDGLLIPASRAKEVSIWCSDLAVQHFGFCPRFKTQF